MTATGAQPPRVLAVITARGGSKGVPGKNVKLLGGKPLLAWTAERALSARSVSRAVLSTDDDAIARCGREHGLDVPFMRPAALAADASPTLPVLQHAVERVESANERYDVICLLQPTTPFRSPGLIDACVQKFAEEDADSLVTVERVPDEHNPEWVFFERGGALALATGRDEPIPRRQELPPAFCRTGSIYLVRRDVLMIQGSLYGRRIVGFETPAGSSVNIDTQADWERAERRAMQEVQS